MQNKKLTFIQWLTILKLIEGLKKLCKTVEYVQGGPIHEYPKEHVIEFDFTDHMKRIKRIHG